MKCKLGAQGLIGIMLNCYMAKLLFGYCGQKLHSAIQQFNNPTIQQLINLNVSRPGRNITAATLRGSGGH